MESTTQQSSYDAVPYTSYPSTLTQPNRLGSLARLFGLSPELPEQARILELGCAGGGNILPLASLYPAAELVGIDLSQDHIDQGLEVARKLQLKNIQLKQGSIEELDRTWGEFDYILCHGVFSWVSEKVRNKILEVFAQNLKPGGVAYLDYNTFPGWHSRGLIRDMMLYHVEGSKHAQGTGDPETQVVQGAQFVDFIANHVEGPDVPYKRVLQKEVEYLRDKPSHYIFHEYFEEENKAFYFHEIHALAQSAGLEYICDSRIESMSLSDLEPEARQGLQRIAQNRVRFEQYLDYIRNVSFRRSLFTKGAQVRPNEFLEHLPHLFFGTNIQDIREHDENMYVRSLQRQERGIADCIMKCILRTLFNERPKIFSYADLYNQLRGGLPELQPSEYGSKLIEGFLHSLVELHYSVRPVPATPPPFPKGFSLGQLQAESGSIVSTAWHTTVQLSELERVVLLKLNGNNSKADLLGLSDSGEEGVEAALVALHRSGLIVN